MDLLSVENGKVKINKKADGIVYEEKCSENCTFKAEIFKEKIKCTRIYEKTQEVFWVKNGEPSLRKEHLADDFARFFYDEDKVLEWHYKKKHFTERRF